MIEIRDSSTGQLILRLKDRVLRRCALNNVCLAATDLSDVDAFEADFSYSTLRGVNLQRASLGRARFSNGHLQEVDFSEAKLLESDFTMSNIQNSSFCRAILAGACLRYAQLAKVDMTSADLRRSDLSMAVVSGVLVDADFRGADLRGADLRETQLHGAQFDGARLSNAQFIGEHPSQYHFQMARLARAQTRPSASVNARKPHPGRWWKFWGSS